jgi:glycosyltransferase involved in cell wall biosynthesis
LQLPAPPPGRSGWPWDGAALAPPDGDWPRITVITPSFNQGRFIEETIRSVLLQGYPRLQYLIVDGGSRDESVEVIGKYQRHLSHWVSEPDRGQPHAINKGFARADGEIVTWLNSDDVFEPGALFTAAEALRTEQVIYGEWLLTDAEGRPTWDSRSEGPRPPLTLADWIPYWKAYPAVQPSIFFRRSLIDDSRLVDESLQYAFDYDLWLRLAERAQFAPLGRVLSRFRLHADCKTVGQRDRFLPEVLRVSRRYWGPPGSLNYVRHTVSRYVWTRSIQEARRAVELSRTDRIAAAAAWLAALARCPIAPLVESRPFLSAPYHILRGW